MSAITVNLGPSTAGRRPASTGNVLENVMTAPAFTFNPQISISDSSISLSGTAAGDFTSAHILANGSDIGAVQVADGQWTFDAAMGSLPSAVGFTLAVTDASNEATSVNSNFGVLLGISNHPYTTMQVSGIVNNTQQIECFNTDGRDIYHMDYVDTGDGFHDLTVSPFLHSDSFVFVGSEAIHETINDFRSSGKFHDTISMPSKDFTSLSDVIKNGSFSADGWTIHDPNTNATLTLSGFTRNDLKFAAHDFTFTGTGHLV